jgi:iron(III) transport system permease protein
MAVSALALLPIVFVLLQASHLGLHQAGTLLWRHRVLQLITNTLKLTVTATLFSIVIGVGAAWLVCRSDVPFRRVFGVLLVLPLAIPDFVAGYAWVSLDPGIHGFSGAVLVTTFAYYPFVYLPAVAMLSRLDPALEEVGRSLGLSRVSVFRRLVLPQLRLAILGGCIVISLHLLAEYGAFSILRYQTFTTEIFAEYNLGFDGASASLLSLVLLVICVVLLGGDLRLRGKASYASVSGAPARTYTLVRLGRARLAALGGLAAVVVLAVGVPFWAVGYWLVQGNSSTLPSGSILGATWTTLFLAGTAAVVTTALALPVAFLLVRHRSTLAALIERGTYMARALPGIVVALAFVFFATRYAAAVYQSTFLLIAAYVVLFLPLALISVEAALAQAPTSLEEVARSLGTRRLAVLWKVTLPLLGPGLLAAAALVFLSTATELTATLILSPTGTTTLATGFWAYTTDLSYGAAAPYAAIMVGLCALPAFVLARYLGAGRTTPST